MPWGDWQFWLVTLAATLAVGALIRVIVPRRRSRQRAELTIERQRLQR